MVAQRSPAVGSGRPPVKRSERWAQIAEETKRCIESYRELGSTGAVAAALGLTPGRVRRRLREAGVTPLVLRVEQAVELFGELGSVRAVATELRVSEAAARNRLFSGVVLGLLEQMPELEPSAAPTGGHLPPDAIAETVALYRELRSLRAVGARLGISGEAVRLRLRAAGEDTRRRDTLDEDERLEIVELWHELQSVTEIAARRGRSEITVRRVLRAEGVSPGGRRSAGGSSPVTEARRLGEAKVIARLYERLGTQAAVAELLGISQGHVSRRLALTEARPGRGNYRRSGPDPEQLKTLRAHFDSGLSVRESARRTGIAYRTALRWLHADGAEISARPGKGRPLDADTLANTYMRYRETYNADEVARELGRSRRTVNRQLQLVTRALKAHRQAERGGAPALEVLPPDEPPLNIPAWVNPDDIVYAKVGSLRELERGARGGFICPLCGRRYWGRWAISQHLHKPHQRCREPGCSRIVVVGGMASHRWNMHGGRAELEALKRRKRTNTRTGEAA